MATGVDIAAEHHARAISRLDRATTWPGSPQPSIEALAEGGRDAAEIERVFLTGGTSFVPAIRASSWIASERTRLTSADQFESIAYGLALIGQTRGPRALGCRRG